MKTPNIHSINDCSESIYSMGDHESTLIFQYDAISMKTKSSVTNFGKRSEP